MAIKKFLIVEGEPGDLRQGISKLLNKKIPGNLPRICLGAGKSQTIDKFKNNELKGDLFLLLIDLDNSEDQRSQDILKNGLIDYEDKVFYMIQEMESWFLSQPDILDSFYGPDSNGKRISQKLNKKPSKEISNPKDELLRVTTDSRKGKYKVIQHAVELLKLLDVDKLENEFIDFKNLIKKLRN